MKFIGRLTVAIALAFAASMNASAEKFSELYYQRASLFDALGVDSTSIVLVGNSLTHGCEWHELLGMPNVLNRGINGDIAEGINQRLDGVLKGKPAKIFLLCGVNDVSHDLTADSIATAVEGLVDRILTESPTTRLYLQSLLPINNSFARYRLLTDKEQTIRDINTRLQKMASSKGVTWIDLYPHFADENGNLKAELTNDGLHLLAPGYMIWKEVLLPYITE